MTLPAIIVHGGATVFKEKFHEAIKKAVTEAARIGMCVFDNGGSSLDAVESAIYVLEETELFTAGRGACKNLDGEIELDAMIMDGNRLESGAVMAVRDIIHPISLARYVLERTHNYQIVGGGANKLYTKMIAEGYREEVEPNRSATPMISAECDTVGAIAVDAQGRIASASSTSGWSGKLPGRVGDSAIIGSGVYANDIAAASCTGRGEQILRIVMGRMAVYHVEQGKTVAEASELVMSELRQKTSGEAGLIMADHRGNLALAFDTPHMPTAVVNSELDVPYYSLKPKWPLSL
ncbi:peptidase T [Candidatus Thorarchaeota archaeon]|nr:MAG: peptidase T [Candidatus Thorarchaeota archaeon]